MSALDVVQELCSPKDEGQAANLLGPKAFQGAGLGLSRKGAFGMTTQAERIVMAAVLALIAATLVIGGVDLLLRLETIR